jgi:hypothetical protein
MKFPTACWLAAAVLIVAPAPAQESAADLLQRGSAKHRSKDYPGAIADFTAAIAQQKTLNSYFHLARAESLRYVQSPQARAVPPPRQHPPPRRPPPPPRRETRPELPKASSPRCSARFCRNR